MRHDMESCDQGGEDQDEAWLDGPVARVSTGRSGCIRWLASDDPTSLQSSLCMGLVYTGRVQCDAVQRLVVLCRRACVVAVGGNGRVQTASDTWLMPEHRTLGVERLVAPCERPVPLSFAQ